MTERTRYLSEGGPIRVLHVDDDACFLKTAKTLLEMRGAFQVETASSVVEAVGKMKTEKYDSVVCDYQMPRKDGLQFLKELREEGNSIPFIIFTGKGREEVAIEALNLGADGYFNKAGNPETVYGELAHGIQQIVDKRRIEQSLLKSEGRYRQLVETLREGIWIIDKDSRTTFVNPRMAEILGYDIKEMKGRHLFSFMDERGVEIAKRFLERRQQGIKEQHDFEFLRKDGTRIYTALETSPITDDNGNYSGALASVMDMTGRNKTEEALRASEEKHRVISGITADLVFSCVKVDEEGFAIDWMVGATDRIFGYSAKEIRNKGCWKFTVQPQDLPTFEEKVTGLKLGQSSVCELRITHKDGSTRWIKVSSQLIRDSTNPAYHRLFGACEDITERKRVEDALRQSKENFESLAENAFDGLLVATQGGVHVYANNRAAEITGYTVAELLRTTVKELVHPDESEKILERYRRRIEGGAVPNPCETVIIAKDGRSVPIELAGARTIWERNPADLVFFRDITERKKAEEALRNSEERWRSLAEGSPDHIMLFDLEFNILYINRTVPDLKREEVIGASLFNYVPPEWRRVAKDCFKRVIETGKPDHYDTEYRTKDGEVRYFNVRIGPVFQKDRVVAFISSSTDVTTQKKAEEKLSILNEKLAVVGKLTRHDVRNKLSAVIGNTYLAKKTLPKDHKALTYLEGIELACRQSTRVLDFAAAYESMDVEGLTLVDVDKAIEEAVLLVSELKGVKVVNNCQGLTVMADSVLRQLFFNLIENSLKHGKNASQIKIHYEEGKDRLKLLYEDNGVGISKANKPKLFTAGFTTRNGLGYGLPLIKRMMETYGWTIEEEGEPGKGARFVITIPKTHVTMRERNT